MAESKSNRGRSRASEKVPARPSEGRCGLALLLKAFLLRAAVQSWVEASASLNHGLAPYPAGPIEACGAGRASEREGDGNEKRDNS
jgi:hypothetical protein